MEHCLGRSLRGVVDGAEADGARAVPTFQYDSVGMRKGRYRLIRYADGSTQFYDVEDDFWQLRDLGQDHPDFPAMRDALFETSRIYGFDVDRAEAAL